MWDRLRQPLFGPWSVLDVVAAFTLLLSPLVVFVMVWTAIATVVERDNDWWPVIALGRLALIALVLSGVRTLYQLIGTRPTDGERHGQAY